MGKNIREAETLECYRYWEIPPIGKKPTGTWKEGVGEEWITSCRFQLCPALPSSTQLTSLHQMPSLSTQWYRYCTNDSSVHTSQAPAFWEGDGCSSEWRQSRRHFWVGNGREVFPLHSHYRIVSKTHAGRPGSLDVNVAPPLSSWPTLNNLLKLPSASISSAENKNKSGNIIVSAP